MRSEIEENFSYPEFQEGPGKKIGRITELTEKRIQLHSNFTCKVMSKTLLEISGQSFPYRQGQELLRVGDWVGVQLDSRKEVILMTLLAPNRLKGAVQSCISREQALGWALYLSKIRQFFVRKGFLEVQTPTLVTCPGTEPHLEPFSTEFRYGRIREQLFLPTSPELHLKKLVAQGWGPLFEIKSCFRNEELSERHEPEFLMLEWYRPGHQLVSLIDDCKKLIQVLAKLTRRPGPRKVHIVTVKELFLRHLGFSLTPRSTQSDLVQLAKSLHVVVPANSDFDDLFHLLFLEKIEPSFQVNELFFVKDYPPSQAALARLTPEGWGDRFELYWKGFELANAFHELNDPKIQRARSAEDLQKKDDLKKTKISLDEEFFCALEGGMPPTAGIALGVERLFLALYDLKQISQIRPFAFYGTQRSIQ